MLALYVRSMDGSSRRLNVGSETTLAEVRAQLQEKRLIVQNFPHIQEQRSLTMGSPPRRPSPRSIAACDSWRLFRHACRNAQEHTRDQKANGFLRIAEADTKESQAAGATAEVKTLVGSCLRRDTTEAAAILSKSLSDEALIC